MAEVANLVVSFNATGQQTVSSAANKVDGDITRLANNSVGSANRIGGAFTSAGKAVAIGFGVVAAAGIVNGVKGLLSLNASAEQYKIQLETVTGSQERANELFKDLQTIAKDTPFEFPELVQASAQLESFGLKTEEWINTIGDTASGTGKTVDQVTQAVLDVQGNQFERLKELGILATVEGDKLKLSYMENGKQITETVDKNNKEIVNSTLQAIWNRKYEGAMKKQSRTFNGMLSTLKDNVKTTMAAATVPIFNFAKSGLDATNRFFDRFNDKRAQGFGVWEAGLRSLHTALNQTLGREAGDIIIGTIRGIGDAFSAVSGAVGTLASELASGDIAGFLGELGGMVLGIGGWAFEQVGSLYDDVTRWVTDSLWPGIARIGSAVGGYVVRVGAWAIDQATSLYDNVSTWVTGTLWPGIKSVGSSVAGYTVRIGGWLLQQTGSLYDTVSSWVTDTLWPGIKNVGQNLSGYVIRVGDWIVQESQSLFQAVQSWVNDRGGFAAEVRDWILRLQEPRVEVGTLDGAVSDEVKKKKTTAILAEWYLAATGRPETEVNRSEAEQAISDQLKGIIAPITDWRLILESNPIIGGVVRVGDGLNEFLNNANNPVKGSLRFWNLELGSPTSLQAVGWNLGEWLGGKIRELEVPNVTLPEWKLNVNTPDIGGLGGAFGLNDFGIKLAIGKLINGITVPLPNWDVDLASIPDIINVPSAATIAGWILDKLPSVTIPLKWIADLGGGDTSSENGIGNASGAGTGGGSGGPPPLRREVGLYERYQQADMQAPSTPPPPMMFPAPDLSKFTAELGKVPVAVNQQMTAATSGAQSGAQALSTAVVSTISAMVPAVTGQLSALVSSVTAQFGAMVASGSGQMAAFVGAVSSGFATMQAVAVSATSSMVGSVIGILSSLPGYGFGIGASLGSGIAGGIQSMIGSVAASAAALVSAAVNAARQAGAISSPSKKTMYLGAMMGEGLVVGMDRMQGRVAASMANLMPTPSLAGSNSYSVPPISRSRNAQARTGDTYIIQGDLLEPREWQNRVRTLAAEGAVTIVDRRMATQQVARR